MAVEKKAVWRSATILAAGACAGALAFGTACRQPRHSEPERVVVERASAAPAGTTPPISDDPPEPPGETLRDQILGVNGHVVVLKYAVDFSEYRSVVERVRGVAGVAAVEPFTLDPMQLAKQHARADVIVKGIDPELMPRVLDLPKHVVEGSLAGLSAPGPAPAQVVPGDAGTGTCHRTTPTAKLPGIVLGRRLARRLGLGVGDCAELTSDEVPNQATPPAPHAFRVIAFFEVGFDEYDSKLAYVDLHAAQAVVGLGDSATGVEVRVDDVERAGEVAQRIRATLGEGLYKTLDWRELNRGLFGPSPGPGVPASPGPGVPASPGPGVPASPVAPQP